MQALCKKALAVSTQHTQPIWPVLSRPVLSLPKALTGLKSRPEKNSVLTCSAINMGPTSFGPDKRPHGLSAEEVGAYMRMARPHNILPSLLLVFLGAWAGAGRSPAALGSPTVWGMAAISAGVTLASMVINDYFDWRSGADVVNAPHKPLPSGIAKPDIAVLLAGALYVLVLMAACMLESPALRAITAFSAGATLLYTPVFKRVTMVKNALVASIIALAPISGALAAGAGKAVLQRLAAPTLFSFTAIMFREVLMDVADVEGDKAAGVTTLPVLVGEPAALLVATFTMLAGGTAGVVSMLSGTVASVRANLSAAAGGATTGTSVMELLGSLVSVQHLPQLACAVLVILALGQLLGQVYNVYRYNFSSTTIAEAVDGCMKPMGLAIIILAAMA